jgi:DNA-binding NarL/FixJ family response regulator
VNVLLVDDHPLILTALASVIEGMGGETKVRGVPDAAAARAALAADPGIDLVLLDLRLGGAADDGTDGFALLSELREAHPATPVVVVSATDRQADVVRAIDLGAMGFVPKRASNETLFEALRVVMRGGVFVPTAEDGAPAGDGAGGLGVGGPAADAPPLSSYKLTPRQTDVLGLLLRGQSNKLIARELNLSVETVKDHVAAVLRALGVHSRTQAVLAVSRMPPDRPGAGAPSAWQAPPPR